MVYFRGGLSVASGDPQESAQGPSWFMACVNDILRNTKSQYFSEHLFADDCSMFSIVRGRQVQYKLNAALKSIAKWRNRRDMKMNTAKPVIMRITNKKKELRLTYFVRTSLLIQELPMKYF